MKNGNAGSSLTTAILVSSLTLAAMAPVAAENLALETFSSLKPGAPINGLESLGMTWQSDSFFAVEAPAHCRADINADGVVNSVDLAEVLSRWSSTSIAADLDFSGIVDGPDLASLLAAWGGCASQPPNIAVQTSDGDPSPFGDAASARTHDPLLVKPYSAIQIIFDYRPALDDSLLQTRIASLSEGFVTSGIGAAQTNAISTYVVGGAVTNKPIVYGEWVTVVYELSRPTESFAVFERTLIRDSQSVAQFGPEPVEIYPAGPYGPATNPSNGQPAPNPSPGLLAAWDQVSWMVNAFDSAGSESHFDNLRIRQVEFTFGN